MKTPTIRLALALCSLGVALPASAADIRDQLTPELIYNHCQTAGVGSETAGTFMLPNGGRVTGSVLCSAEDLAAARTMSARYSDNDDEDDEDDDYEDDDRDD